MRDSIAGPIITTASRSSTAACSLIAQLHPQGFRADGNSLLGNAPCRFGITEDIHHIHFFRHISQRGISLLPQQRFPGNFRRNGNNVIALIEKYFITR
jgi:hypothetical protein